MNVRCPSCQTVFRVDPAKVALIVVDVDRLKEVNDVHGHEAGDRTLQAVAAALNSLEDKQGIYAPAA